MHYIYTWLFELCFCLQLHIYLAIACYGCFDFRLFIAPLARRFSGVLRFKMFFTQTHISFFILLTHSSVYLITQFNRIYYFDLLGLCLAY